jgi:hypothetical protein
VLPNQKAMMVAQTPLQSGGEVPARASELGMAEFRQTQQIVFARHDRLQDAPTAPAQDI